MVRRTLPRPGRIRVLIESKTGLGDGQEFTYADPMPAYARFGGTKSINVRGSEGFIRQDAPTLQFQMGGKFNFIRTGSGRVSELTLGSRITWEGRYYTVIRTLYGQDFTQRLMNVTAILEDGGKAPTVAVAAVIDPRASDQGVDHDIRPTPRSAIRGGTKR